jgi:hypothetical protein
MRRYPFLIGCLFGTLQTGYFLQLSFAFSSAAVTLFGITLGWLAGSGLGLWLAGRPRNHSARWLRYTFLSVGSYLLCGALLAHFPLQSAWLPVYGALVVASGVYAGWFFGTAGATWAGRIDRLFFWENNGFVVGLVLATILYLWVGRIALVVLPLGLGLYAFPRRVYERNPGETTNVMGAINLNEP